MSGPPPAVPGWLRRVADTAHDDIGLVRRTAHLPHGRESAVLMLFGPGESDPDRPAGGATVILTERAHSLRRHPGQVSFPGGGVDPADAGPVAAALREAQEEVGVDPEAVQVLGELPRLPLSVTGFSVTPILGWWVTPGPVGVVDPGEVERVITMPVDALLDPANRFTAVYPARSFNGPAFEVADVYVWGFTAIVLSEFFDLAGLTLPWDRADERLVPDRFLAG